MNMITADVKFELDFNCKQIIRMLHSINIF